jgi:2-keto-4-pentenoate hydratase
MTLTHSMIDEAASLLHAAQANSAPVGQLTARFPDMDVADAYAIQQVNLGRRRQSPSPGRRPLRSRAASSRSLPG